MRYVCEAGTVWGTAAGHRPNVRMMFDGSPAQANTTMELRMETQIKVIVEKHSDGYIAYPLGVKGVVVGQGDSYQAALDDVRSAIAFHVETFGAEALVDDDSPVVEAFVAEASMTG